MNNLSKLCLFLFLIIIVASSVYGMEFGNVAIFVDKTTIQDIDSIYAQLEGDTNKYSFESNSQIIIWNIHPGVHQLNLIDKDGNVLNSLSVNVFPNLTNKITLSIKEKQFTVEENGFADAAGHIFTFTQEEIRNLPGEMSDGLGMLGSVNNFSNSDDYSFTSQRNITWTISEVTRGGPSIASKDIISYDGLQLLTQSGYRAFGLSSSMAPDLAIVNLSDPFGGYNNSEISLISNFNNPNQIKTETVIGERDRKFYRGMAGYNLPNNIGSIFGSVSIENLGDAFPRSNVNGVLPHNSMDNAEFTAGAGVNISPKIKSDFRMFYRNYKSDIYNHYYYFNQTHAPREEGYLYGGKLSVYGKLQDGLFFDAGFALSGDENKTGDGLYFDDVDSYHRENWPGSGNPATDGTGLFWSWDDIEGVTIDIDEAHVFDDYYRERSRGWKANIGLSKNLDNSTQLFLDAAYSGSTFRKLQYLFPANRDTINMIDIGFDRYGNIIDDNGLTELPNPTLLEVFLGAKHITENYTITGALDYLSFNSNVLTVKDIQRPFKYGDSLNMDMPDLTDATPKSKLGFKLAADYALYENIRLFSSFSLKYYIPANKYLFNSLRYYENKIKSGGYYYSFGNPNLEPEKNRAFELGISFNKKNNYFALSYKKEKADDIVQATTVINVDPKSYSLYLNEDKFDTDVMTFSYQRKGSNFFNCAIAASISDFELAENKIVALGRFNPSVLYKQSSSTMQKILSHLSFDFSFQYQPGVLYTPSQAGYDPVTLFAVTSTPAGAINSSRAKDYIELNLGITANILKFAGGSLIVRGEIINIFNRENHLDVYSTSGSASATNWLTTEAGQDWLEANAIPDDTSGLTGEEKYILASDDPNNFGRPRMFRLIARLEF